MPSRMDRYYQSDEVSDKRTSRNHDLYKKIYEQAEYTNIEGIASIEKTNEIDISKIQELLKGREKKEKKVEENTIQIPSLSEASFDERNYDIREVLNKARDTKVEDDKKRSISNTEYNVLKNTKLKDRYNFEEDEKELKELLHTISKTGMLSKLEDNDLSLDLFSDLKSVDGTMIGNSSTIQNVLKEEKKKEIPKEAEMDKSFFTTSVNFSNDDFEIEDEKPKKDHKIVSKILVILLFVVVALAEIFIVFKYIV